ncbi:HNH endonuclease signature motif containing protein [Streptacidiphilus sp. PAMC 29251]
MRKKIRIIDSGCWEWTGAVSTSGYGRTYWDTKAREAHRVIYGLLVGPIPEGMVLDHICHTEKCLMTGRDCSHRRCQNPDHLRPVTRGANAMRSASPPAMNAAKTACDQGHEYTDTSSKIDGGTRRCLICRREADKRRRPRGLPRTGSTRTREFRPMPNFPTHRS